MLDTFSIFLNLLRFYLWPRMWSILENVPRVLEKKVYFSAFGWNVLKISVKSISSNVSFKTSVSWLTFCFDDLSFGVSGVLRSPTIIVLLSVSPFMSVQFSSVQYSVMSDSLRPHESQHSRPPCPSPSPGVHSDSRPSSSRYHPATSSWVVPFSCSQSLPASESFPMSQLFAWGGQGTGVSALALRTLRADLL